ncbi:MAG: hypothetical protein J6V24_12060, partial [Clostridia bacterium]|nr:hypothetical protein [Clostridia bacterium]
MKKLISLFLVLCLTLGSAALFTGCSESGTNDEGPSENPTGPSSADVGGEEEPETEWIDPFAGTDFSGREFRVYTSVDDTDATNGNA